MDNTPLSICTEITVPKRIKKQGVAHKYEQNSDGKYICSYCSFTTAKKPTMSEHVSRLHAKEAGRQINPFICNYCQKPFQSKSAELHHIKTHHEIQLTRCLHDNCNYDAKTDAALYAHYTRKHLSESFSRPISNPVDNLGKVECTICKKKMQDTSIYYHFAKCYHLSPFFTGSDMHDDGGELILFKPVF